MSDQSDLVKRLREEADLCRNETATDVANLLDEAADALERQWSVIDLTDYINGADISAADGPATVVLKLQAAINATPPPAKREG